MHERPHYYHRDGSPIVSPDPAISETLVWATEFEGANRQVAQNITPYGERLSTVFLGLDHSFSETGPPILFETMLFAPESDGLKEAKRERLRKLSTAMLTRDDKAIEEMERFAEEEYIEQHYPHDCLQQRYTTEAEALKAHQRIKLQCLIPPRWRKFILYTIFKDEVWS